MFRFPWDGHREGGFPLGREISFHLTTMGGGFCMNSIYIISFCPMPFPVRTAYANRLWKALVNSAIHRMIFSTFRKQ